jgi:DNA-binding MarR family transcriptional regulator
MSGTTMFEHLAEQQSAQRPIGYWLRRADQAITAHVDEVHGDKGVSRVHWQVLHLIQQGGAVTAQSVFEEMRDFVRASEFDAVVRELERRGWIAHRLDTPATPVLELTEPGRRFHSDVMQAQTDVRQRAMEGITPEEYATTVRVLQRIVSNLGG